MGPLGLLGIFKLNSPDGTVGPPQNFPVGPVGPVGDFWAKFPRWARWARWGFFGQISPLGPLGIFGLNFPVGPVGDFLAKFPRWARWGFFGQISPLGPLGILLQVMVKTETLVEKEQLRRNASKRSNQIILRRKRRKGVLYNFVLFPKRNASKKSNMPF